jgi:hypothetical protein
MNKIASIPFKPNEFMQNKADFEHNYCHQKGHFANEC